MPKHFRLKLKASRIVCLLALLTLVFHPVLAQPPAEPQREQLLNGLDILLWPIPGSSNVTIKLRIHSGAAFDLAGKAGQMSLLGDLLFPDPATLEYFTEEMGGRLEVRVDYDSTTITMEGKANEFEKIIDVLHNALISTQTGADVVDQVKKARTKMLWDTSVSPAMTADRAISSRLFGDFPYGRPAAGSLEEIDRVERGDLMLARDRFLNSNNATMVISGGVTPARTMRTLRQMLGAWRKSEQIVPTTFKQPPAADPRVLLIKVPTETAEVRLAVRGVARSDADSATADVLAKILYQRWVESFPILARKTAFVRSETHVLPGIFILGTGIEETQVADAIMSARKTIDSAVATLPTAAELERAKNLVVAENAAIMAKPGAAFEPWLDQRTYKLKAFPDFTAQTMAVTAKDVQRVAGRLFKDVAVAGVVIGDPMHLKTVLENRFPVEILGEAQTTNTPAKPPAKPVASPNPR